MFVAHMSLAPPTLYLYEARISLNVDNLSKTSHRKSLPYPRLIMANPNSVHVIYALFQISCLENRTPNSDIRLDPSRFLLVFSLSYSGRGDSLVPVQTLTGNDWDRVWRHNTYPYSHYIYGRSSPPSSLQTK